jgi:alanine-glyoxylate transaminase/serine-glyoxylate transaminase/serine-pyruvate transaminase
MRSGRHFLQIPGPTNVPDRVLRAMDLPTTDHRGPGFAELGRRVLDGMKRIVKTESGEVVIYPASGTGAWEAALVNTLSPGDRVLMVETGHFAMLWQRLAARIGLRQPEGADADARPVVQRRQPEGAGGPQDRQAAPRILGLVRDDGPE